MTRRVLCEKNHSNFTSKVLLYPNDKTETEKKARAESFSQKVVQCFLYFFIEEIHLRSLFSHARVFHGHYLKATGRTTLTCIECDMQLPC